MKASNHRKIRGVAATSAGLLVCALEFGAGALTAAHATPNTLSSSVAPGSVAAASNARYAYTVTNTSGLSGNALTLGSMQVTAPSSFGAPSSITPPAGWTVVSQTGNSFCISGGNLPSGSSLQFAFNDLAQPSAGSASFSTDGFTGTNCVIGAGDLLFTGDSPTVQVDALVYSAHSTSGTAGSPITPGYTVSAQNASGGTDTSFTEPVTLSLGQNPGSAALTGAGPVTPTNGSASFTPTISAGGAGYTLLAKSDGSPGVASEPIYIVNPATGAAKSVTCPAGQSCDTGRVQPGASSPTAAEAIGDPGASTDVVSIAVGDQPAAACAGSTLPSPAPLDVFVGDFNRHLTVKVLYDRDRDSDPFSGFTKKIIATSAAWKKVCFQGSNDPAPHLLAACTTTDSNGYGAPEPCIAAEFAEPDDTTRTADVLMVLSLNPDPDPHIIGGLL